MVQIKTSSAWWILIIATRLIVPCEHARGDDDVHVDRGRGGMVVCDTAVASRIGREILTDGGNAVDAAVATAMALAVSWPEAGNIGGGGFMLIRTADGRDAVCVDYRETAPLVMNVNSFKRTDTRFSQKAVGVPGTVRGLAEAHRRYGKLPWVEVVMPAVRLAKEGVVVDAPLARSLNAVLQNPSVKESNQFAELRRVYGTADGSPWQIGSRLVLPDLGATLELIAQRGADGFYTGRVAQQLVDEMKRGDGLISLDDLRRYEAKVRPMMRGTFRGYTILGAPPPSSGGTCVIEALNILENFDLSSRDRFDPENIHLIAESCRRVFADRARFLGDPDFTEIPNHLTSKEYARELADSIQRDRASKSAEIAAEISLTPESDNTTHFSVIDAEGMAVSNTYTLEASWGSRLVVGGAGFVLNNEMGDFNWFPGETNRQGRIGTAANLVAPGKRMLSSQSPTMVEKNGELVLITGSPGGRTIINTVLCIVLGVTEFSLDPATAVAAPRMHHQWFPDRLELESLSSEPHAGVAEALRQLGHQVTNRSVQGSAHTIGIDLTSGDRIGVADFRRGGRPAATADDRIALWDFSDPAGTPIASCQSAVSGRGRWRGDRFDATTDGLDRLRIAGGNNDMGYAQYDLPVDTGSVSVELKIASANWVGETAGERLRVQFIDGQGKLVAEATLRRRENGDMVVGDQNDELPELETSVLGRHGRLGPTLIRIQADGIRDRQRIAVRKASEVAWTRIRQFAFDPDAEIAAVRLQIDGPFGDDGETILLDRIDIRVEEQE